MTLWALLVVACSPASSCLTACSCSYSREFVFGPFAGSSRFRPGRLTTVAVICSGGNSHPDRVSTCQAHDCASPLPLSCGGTAPKCPACACGSLAGSPQSARGLAHSKTWRKDRRSMTRASVLDCGSPLPLSADPQTCSLPDPQPTRRPTICTTAPSPVCPGPSIISRSISRATRNSSPFNSWRSSARVISSSGAFGPPVPCFSCAGV